MECTAKFAIVMFRFTSKLIAQLYSRYLNETLDGTKNEQQNNMTNASLRGKQNINKS